MGFLLGILYLVTYYLSPSTVFGPLAHFRIELIIALLILLVSVPALMRSFILKTPQFLALLGLAFATCLSVVIGGHWAKGGVLALLTFIPNAFAFLVVCLHCKTKKQLQILVLMLLFVCLFVIGRGYSDLRRGINAAPAANPGALEAGPNGPEAAGSPYLLAQESDSGESVNRLRGRGEINDPNDFSQLLIAVIPLVFIFWRPKRRAHNLVCVILPVGGLLFGAYLTHSRGFVVAFLAVAFVAARRRIGTLPALVIVGLFLVAASALQFSGGRAMSAESGADRTALWGEGLQAFKSHPLFGVGAGNMPGYTDDGKTVHNSIVVCAAELGTFGFYFWSMFLFSALRDILVIASPKKVGEAQPIIEDGPFPRSAWKPEVMDKAEVNRLGHLMLLSFTGFLAAGWFLSRSYVLTLFLLSGMVEVIYQMALRQQMVPPRMRLQRVLVYTVGFAVALLVAVYIMLRILNRVR
ncbi:MAG: O-antigen ligase family protein [Terracidiphilus sp.]|jgi:O-antigen ligase